MRIEMLKYYTKEKENCVQHKRRIIFPRILETLCALRGTLSAFLAGAWMFTVEVAVHATCMSIPS